MTRLIYHSFIWHKSWRIHDSSIRIWRGSVIWSVLRQQQGRTTPLFHSYDIRHDVFTRDMTHPFGYDVAQSCVSVMVAVGWYDTTHSYVWHGTWLTHMWHDTCASIRMWRGSLMSVWVITAAGSGDVTYSYMRLWGRDVSIHETRLNHFCDITHSFVWLDQFICATGLIRLVQDALAAAGQ